MSLSSSGQDLVERLEQDHVGAQAAEGGGHLGAGRAGADHGEALGLLVDQPHRRGVEDAPAELQAGHGAGAPSRRRGSRCRPRSRCRRRSRRPSRCRRRSREPKPSIRSILFFSNSIDTPPVSVLITLSRCLVAPPKSNVHVADLDAEALGPADLLHRVGHAQERLGRDARLVEAAPAGVALLDHGGLHPELGGADGGHVAARARSRSRCSRTCSPAMRGMNLSPG